MVNGRNGSNCLQNRTIHIAEDQAEWPCDSTGVSIKTAQEKFYSHEENFSFEIINSTDSTFYYWSEFQYNQDDVWYLVPARPGWPPIEMTANQIVLSALKTEQLNIWLNDYDDLHLGKYRIVVYVDGSDAKPPYNADFILSYMFIVE